MEDSRWYIIGMRENYRLLAVVVNYQRSPPLVHKIRFICIPQGLDLVLAHQQRVHGGVGRIVLVQHTIHSCNL